MSSETAYNLLCRIKHIPCADRTVHAVGSILFGKPCSKGERRRLLQNKAVQINGKRPAPDDEICFPIRELVFFPNSQERKCTMIYETSVDKTENLICEYSETK